MDWINTELSFDRNSMPSEVQLDLVQLRNETCVARDRDAGARFHLINIRCRIDYLFINSD